MQWLLEGVVAASSVVPSLNPERKGDIKDDIETVFLNNTRIE